MGGGLRSAINGLWFTFHVSGQTQARRRAERASYILHFALWALPLREGLQGGRSEAGWRLLTPASDIFWAQNAGFVAASRRLNLAHHWGLRPHPSLCDGSGWGWRDRP
ncbi:MAG: hypothetical protein DMG05_06420 [Acidobacteria bacterium]|nr:MAG: hypothetical protein DMG05_06420 [Acidobacteriota bacterium]